MPHTNPNKTTKGRIVRLFKNGRNQALRIPRNFEFEGEEALMRREGDRLIIEPIRRSGLLVVLDKMEPLDIDFPDVNENLEVLDEIDI